MASVLVERGDAATPSQYVIRHHDGLCRLLLRLTRRQDAFDMGRANGCRDNIGLALLAGPSIEQNKKAMTSAASEQEKRAD